MRRSSGPSISRATPTARCGTASGPTPHSRSRTLAWMAEQAPGSVAGPARARAGYIDWLRGLAVVIMILAHAVDSWTVLGPTRHAQPYFWFMVLAGMGAPLFLWLAGLAVPLAAHARLRRG